jgi:hypothetical protein
MTSVKGLELAGRAADFLPDRRQSAAAETGSGKVSIILEGESMALMLASRLFGTTAVTGNADGSGSDTAATRDSVGSSETIDTE